MSKYCLIDEEQYRPGNIGAATASHYPAYKERCINYIDGLIQKYNPKAFIIMTGSELDLKTLHSEIIDYLVDFPIHVFSPAWPDDYPKPNWVTHHTYQSYDHILYEQCIGWFMFEKQKPNWYGHLAPDKLYTCYNNMPRDYRHYTIDQLAKHNLLDKGIVTAKFTTVDQINQPDYHPAGSWPFEHLPWGTQLVDEPDFVLNSTLNYGCQRFPKSFGKGAIDIVTESRIDEGEFYLSEKTNKSLLAHKPFLVVSCQGYHRWLKETRGIELYDELFDYSFDDEPDYKKRIEGIVANIKRLSEEHTTPEDYKRLLESCKQKTIRNFIRHMHVMSSGKNTHVFNEFMGIKCDSVKNLHRDKRSDYFYNCRDGDDVDRHFNFYYQYAIPNMSRNWITSSLNNSGSMIFIQRYGKYFPKPELKDIFQSMPIVNK